jgi:hypothetical protein
MQHYTRSLAVAPSLAFRQCSRGFCFGEVEVTTFEIVALHRGPAICQMMVLPPALIHISPTSLLRI